MMFLHYNMLFLPGEEVDSIVYQKMFLSISIFHIIFMQNISTPFSYKDIENSLTLTDERFANQKQKNWRSKCQLSS